MIMPQPPPASALKITNWRGIRCPAGDEGKLAGAAALRAQFEDIGYIDQPPALQRTTEGLLFARLHHADDTLQAIDDSGKVAATLAQVAQAPVLTAQDSINTGKIYRRRNNRWNVNG